MPNETEPRGALLVATKRDVADLMAQMRQVLDAVNGLKELIGAARVPSPSDDDLLSTSEVAELAHVEPKTVREWVRKASLKAVRAPGSRRFLVRRADFQSYLSTSAPVASSAAEATRILNGIYQPKAIA